MTTNDSTGYAPQGYYDPIEIEPGVIVDHDDPRTTYLYIDIQYRGDWWGEDSMVPTGFTTTGDLFRALNGREELYSYRALGRCTGKVYIDTADGARQVGWIFVARNPEPVRRGDTQPTGLREAWVTVHEAPPTVTTTHHYATFGKER